MPIGLSMSNHQASPRLLTFLSVISFIALKCLSPKSPPSTIQLTPWDASAKTLASFTSPAFAGAFAEDPANRVKLASKPAAIKLEMWNDFKRAPFSQSELPGIVARIFLLLWPAGQEAAGSLLCACSLRFRLQSQCRVVALPLLLHIRHKRNKLRILSQVVQVSVTLKKRIAREALIGGYLQPFESWIRPVHKRVCRRDAVRRVMKVSVASTDLDGALDRVFGFAFLARLGQHHGFHAGNQPALIVWIALEELLNDRRSFLVPPQPE